MTETMTATTAEVRRYLDYRQAGDYLGVSAKTIERAVAAGLIPAIRHGRRVTVDRHDLDAYAAQLKTTPAAAAK